MYKCLGLAHSAYPAAAVWLLVSLLLHSQLQDVIKTKHDVHCLKTSHHSGVAHF